jgi:hypothetical protein
MSKSVLLLPAVLLLTTLQAQADGSRKLNIFESAELFNAVELTVGIDAAGGDSGMGSTYFTLKSLDCSSEAVSKTAKKYACTLVTEQGETVKIAAGKAQVLLHAMDELGLTDAGGGHVRGVVTQVECRRHHLGNGASPDEEGLQYNCSLVEN